ncbi:MAG TPA: hypothetical protein VFM80_03530 [Gracilimonas sp.]|uniref:hypothetical protein n=1 Tax=Gracilimonas sp. TaxID=1974203 RepID=UPI002D94AE9A|nr:hypothetical protein [Gracilimonas sp.]
MAEVKISDLEKKKQKLEEELVRIQGGIDKSIDEVKEGVSSNMDPKNIIRKYPLPVVGASLVVGFLLGKNRKNTERISSKNHNTYGVSDSGITRELKRVLAKKGLSLLLDYLDDKVASLKEKKRPSGD